MLASLLYPYDVDAPKLIDGWLQELEREECIVRYQCEGNVYLQVVKWLTHQRIDHPSKSKIPSLDESSRLLASHSRNLAPDLGSWIKEKDQRNTPEPQPSLGPSIEDFPPVAADEQTIEVPQLKFTDSPTRAAAPSSASASSQSIVHLAEAIYGHYPRKVAKALAIKATEKAIARIARRGEVDKHPDFAGDCHKAAKWLESRVIAYANSPCVTRTEKRYIPHPATWINQARFDDSDSEWEIGVPLSHSGSKSGYGISLAPSTPMLIDKLPDNMHRKISHARAMEQMP
jgi:hypothetical protein